MTLFLQAQEAIGRSTELPHGYGASLLQSLIALFAVCILAWALLRWASKRGLGGSQGRQIKILERVSLDPRRQLYLVKIGEKILLLGAGEGAAPRLLTEIDPTAIANDDRSFEPSLTPSFASIINRFRGHPEKEQ